MTKDYKNLSQIRQLKHALKERKAELETKLYGLNKQMKKEGFSVELFRQINITEHSLMVCEKRMAGKNYDPRDEFELTVPKRAS